MNIYTTAMSAASTMRVERVSISARPIITRINPGYVHLGYDKKVSVEGYSLDTVEKVYLSASAGIYTTAELSGVSAFDLFGSLSGLSATYPSFSGFEVKSSDFKKSKNVLTLSVSGTQALGGQKINILIKNPAGYTIDSTRTLSISA